MYSGYAVKAKFHYAIQLASWSQTSSRWNSIKLSSLWPPREPARVADQVANLVADNDSSYLDMLR